MSEALIRWLADRQAIAFVMLLVSLVLVLVRTLNLIDGAQFMTGWLALGGVYLGSEFFKAKSAP